MAIDYELILDEFILLARAALPTGLSLIGENADIPAVIRLRQLNGVKPDYPYVTVDVLDTTEEHGWRYNSYLNSDELLVTEVNKQLLLSYRVYGGNANSLANTLQTFFAIERVLSEIRDVTTGAVVTVTSIDSRPILLADKFLESASFNIVFSITDSVVDPLTQVFDTINLDGKVSTIEQPSSIEDISITVTQP